MVAIAKFSLLAFGLFASATPLLEERSPFFEERSPLLEERSPFFEERSPLLEERSPLLEERSSLEERNYDDCATDLTGKMIPKLVELTSDVNGLASTGVSGVVVVNTNMEACAKIVSDAAADVTDVTYFTVSIAVAIIAVLQYALVLIIGLFAAIAAAVVFFAKVLNELTILISNSNNLMFCFDTYFTAIGSASPDWEKPTVSNMKAQVDSSISACVNTLSASLGS